MTDRLEAKELTRKEREHIFRVGLVLDAALTVFMDQPLATAKIEDIAARAELSVTTLYNLFENKEDIYKLVVSRQQDRCFDALERGLYSAAEPIERIHSFIRAFFTYVTENFAGWRFYTYASAGLSATLRKELFAELLQRQATFLKLLTIVCQEGVGRGVFGSALRPADMAVAVNSVPHSCLAFAFHRNDPDFMVLMPVAVEAVNRIIGLRQAA